MNASEQIDKQISELDDWRGKTISRLRKIVHDADPDIVEEWKWGTAVFSDGGMVCGLGVFKDHVKVNFFKGASLEDKKKLFNAGLEAKATRAIDISEKDKINEPALKELIRAAVAINMAKNNRLVKAGA
jgi:hypothetical protein